MFALLVATGLFLTSCGGKPEVVYDVPLEQMIANARETGRDFCVILSRTDCPPCGMFINSLGNHPNSQLFGNATFNVVDVMLPENQWYMQWLCSGAFPTTCVFSSEGSLKAVVSGSTQASISCIESSRAGDTKCAEYFFTKHFPVLGDYFDMLNSVLDCKLRFDRGEDIGRAVDMVLQQTDYPYPVYLKVLNEEKQGRHDEAVRFAERLLQYHDLRYFHVYNDQFKQAKYIIDPNYTPQNDGVLSMTDEILMGDCKVGEPHKVTIRVENTGDSPAHIRDIQLSCSCLELLSPKQHTLESGESVDIELEFTADSKGEVFREVIFFSDSSESMQRVALRAQVS